jgi:DNA-binding transcriptional LysR family regulator
MLPSYAIRPSYGDTAALAKEIVAEHLDAAIVTLPLANPELHIELLRRDRLVVCIRQDRRGRRNVGIPEGFPKSVGRVGSRLHGIPYSVISIGLLFALQCWISRYATQRNAPRPP